MESALGRGRSACSEKEPGDLLKSGSEFEARTTVFPHDPSTVRRRKSSRGTMHLRVICTSRLRNLILQQVHPGEDESPCSPVSIEGDGAVGEACRAASQGEVEIRVHALQVVWEKLDNQR